MDDSISVIDANTVAVHIADPTSFIPLQSDLDINASLRSVTYYYPNKGIQSVEIISFLITHSIHHYS